MTSGKLVIVATPIGNLGDITLRGLDALRDADIIAAEDTRRTIKLLNHYEITNKLLSFHQYSAKARYEEILAILRDGKTVALVSDAGTPVISDPGYELVALCLREGIAVESLPGPCAAVTAVTLSGKDCEHFMFWGFLNAKSAVRKKELAQILDIGVPCVVYESPNRIKKMLEDLCAIGGGKTVLCICRELTKRYEETLRMTAERALDFFAKKDAVKGEFALVLFPSHEEKETTDEEIKEVLEACLDKGMTKKDAAVYAKDTLGVSKNRAYQLLLKL
ncbi:MAG: 16S rRNA (cytidine(1402)-2'-O)-methyltransferase [Christensenella sp.]|nr:16S rRNA (cytidine(1402)-2'-O)-methyltransferase [Christensenella sp.]